MRNIDQYFERFTKAIEDHKFQKEPMELYEPMNYILTIGGKRLRPLITLISCDLFNGDIEEAIKPALAIEYFHNFTLMHDDIMDSGTLRRGKECVHKKFGVNAAILSGDALLIEAFRMFDDLEPALYKKVVTLFNTAAVRLCEGQQYDMNFEEKEHVDFDEYMRMIYYKTGVLTAVAFQIGALIGKASDEDAKILYDLGKHLGIAFQLKDDLLDVFGNRDKIGKKHAGDIQENKKTILYIKALEKGSAEDIKELNYWYDMRTDNIDKIYGVEGIFKRLCIDKDVRSMIEDHAEKAKNYLKEINVDNDKKAIITNFIDSLTVREY